MKFKFDLDNDSKYIYIMGDNFNGNYDYRDFMAFRFDERGSTIRNYYLSLDFIPLKYGMMKITGIDGILVDDL